MTRQIDWHANFEALLNRTPHDAPGLGKTARREATTSVLGGRAGWRHVGGCLLWLLIGGGIAALYVVTLLARMT